jgi:hypothetical protein
VSIGDVHSNDRGSAARFNSGKPAFDLVPLAALADCARVFDYGRAKYAEWNWAKGQPWSVPFACLMRHMAAWQAGEDLDPESGLPHLGHAMANLVMLSTFARTYREGDDRTQWLRETVQPASDLREGVAELRGVMGKYCGCRDRLASECPGEWEPGCAMGANEAHQVPAGEGAEAVLRTARDPDYAAYIARWAGAPAEATHLVQEQNYGCWWVDRRPYQNLNGFFDGGTFVRAGENLLGRVACEPRPRELGGEG